MNHYSRDKGMQAAERYLNLLEGAPTPMLRLRAKTRSRPIAKPETSRWLALCWFVSLIIWRDK